MKLHPMLMSDFYKIAHRIQYPSGTKKVYSTGTFRTSRIDGVNHAVYAGGQMVMKDIHDFFEENFFKKDIQDITADYRRIISNTLGEQQPEVKHIEDLHSLGCLPVEFKDIPEGTIVPIRTPVFTIENTIDEFFWVTNFLETLISCEFWQLPTSATISLEYMKLFKHYADKTASSSDFVPFQGHDFSMRGMSSLQSAVKSGMGHLMSGFVGTDTIPAIQGLEYYYGADVEKELVGTSVPATEHSIQCCYKNDEEYIQAMLDLYPSGIISIVSDGYDFWNVIRKILPKMKDQIMARTGSPIGIDKVVIRHDSGDPVLNMIGNPDGESVEERKGIIECLYDIFGGTINEKGYIELDPHIGAIYGDAITIDRATRICEGLTAKGFATTNMVYGIGSFTYQYNTRDTLGFAIKATYTERDDEKIHIFKDPKTDDGVKKSQRGKVCVFKDWSNVIQWSDGLDTVDNKDNLLTTLYKDGRFYKETNLSEIRQRIQEVL